MEDRKTVMSWLEGLAEPDWPMYHSESEVQNIAKEALDLLKEDCHNCKLECLLQKYDELKEKYDSLLKEQEHKDKMFHALEEDWKRLKELLKEQEKQRFFVDEDGKITPLPVVVRCKDCKHRDPEDKKCDCGHDIHWQLPRQDDWFCADGERKPTQPNAKNDALDVR